MHLAMDGSEVSLTFGELDAPLEPARGGARGPGRGPRRPGRLGIRNSPEFVFAVLATWKVGGVPIPVRWDVPDWELDRLKEVIEPSIYIGPDDLAWIAATAGDPVPELPDVLSPNSNGICSSGATGTPKVILADNPALFNQMMGTPIAAMFMPVSHPQRILVLAPMYHINAFATLSGMLTGDQLFVSRSSTRRGSSTPSSVTASRRSPGRRRCCSGSPISPVSTTTISRASSGS